jgi:hypothetical protein
MHGPPRSSYDMIRVPTKCGMYRLHIVVNVPAQARPSPGLRSGRPCTRLHGILEMVPNDNEENYQVVLIYPVSNKQVNIFMGTLHVSPAPTRLHLISGVARNIL